MPLILLAGLVVYFGVQLGVRASGSAVLDLDEAEQVVLAQWWLWGYSGQPPLYTWGQAVFFALFGVNLWALALYKHLLLLAMYLLFYRLADALLQARHLALLATLSLLWLPQVVWEAQRDLSHSVLVTVLALASFYALVRLLQSPPHLGRYLLVAVCLPAGVLAKYNFVLFVAALGLAVLLLPEGRRALWHPYSLLAGGLLVLLLSPHLLWLWHSPALGTASLDKLWFDQAAGGLTGLWSLLLAVAGFLTPLWLVFVLFWGRVLAQTGRIRFAAQPLGVRLLAYYALSLLVLCVLLVLLAGVTQFKERWMLPLLVILPLLAFAQLRAVPVVRLRLRGFLGVSVGVMLAVVLAMAVRVHDLGSFGPAAARYPFDTAAQELVMRGLDQGLIVGERALWAGNLHLRLPQSTAIFPGVNPKGLGPHTWPSVVLVWDAHRSSTPPAPLLEYAVTVLGLDLEQAVVQQLSLGAPRAQMGLLWPSATLFQPGP
ncbi:glycosyltransferase family 39 protein [Thiorhodospira sibirica]|uniref:glycosyltransferase family 39 protein n=1 Tax=Thiorhodospira sibirica TaxID=154347 RepID=UPI00022C1D65|nr:glycosyltransferase family 39 protein [Thiorhodospira sibirica]